MKIPPEVARKLGHYVYLYIDPRTGNPFYVGKGKGRRALAHLSVEAESRKRRHIAELDAVGLKPTIEILTHALPDEGTAFRVEAAVIDLLKLDRLTNEIRGWSSVQTGRMPLRSLIAYYAAKPVHVIHPALLIRINRLYRHQMSAVELYEATRGVWRLGPRRERAQIAMAVFEGLVRGVYEIQSWHQAGSTAYVTRARSDVSSTGRWEFIGRPASRQIQRRYLD